MGLATWLRDRAVDFLIGIKLDRVTTAEPYEHSKPLDPIISEKGMAMRVEEPTRPDLPQSVRPEPKPVLKGSIQDRLQKARKKR